MKTILGTAALAAATLLPVSTAYAQRAPAAVIVTVDRDKLLSTCNACKAAQTQLQSQGQQLQALAQSLGQPIRTEAEAIEKAAGGKAPDAALQQRITALQTKQNQANQQLAQRQQQFQRNQAYVLQQFNDKVDTIVSSVMQQKGANIAIDVGATIAAAASLDITNDVLAQLNSQLPSINTTAPAAPAQPAGR